VVSPVLRYVIVVVLALCAARAHAGMGMTTLPAVADDGPVTVFYPTASGDRPVPRGPFTIAMAPDAPPQRGNGRLVAISHGSGGAPWVHTDLARALVEAGFVVAMPEHQGDSFRGVGKRGPDSWKQRPGEVSRAIDAVAADPRFAPLLALDQVGVYGMSAGGHTALSLAGGRWSPKTFLRHCEDHIADDFHTCAGLFTRLRGNALDGLKQSVALGVMRLKFSDATWQTHHDPRVRAVVAGVPAAADFEPASLAQPHVALGFVTAAHDAWLVPRFHAERILAACASCEHIAHLPTGGHGALLSPPPPREALGELELALLGDPPGFDRAGLLPEVDRRIVAFFRRHLPAR
jgi:predicted dienelactone hydrolase